MNREFNSMSAAAQTGNRASFSGKRSSRSSLFDRLGGAVRKWSAAWAIAAALTGALAIGAGEARGGVFTPDFTSFGTIDGGDQTPVYTPAEIASLQRSFDYVNSVITTPTWGNVRTIRLLKHDDRTITEPSHNGFGEFALAHANYGSNGRLCFNTVWTFSTNANTQFANDISMESIGIHEFGHSLTMSISRSVTRAPQPETESSPQIVGIWTLDPNANAWGRGIVQLDKNNVASGSIQGLATHSDNPSDDTLETRLANGFHYVFRGTNSGGIYGDTWIAGNAARDVDVEAGFQTGLTYENGSSMSHTYTRFGVLNSTQTGAQRPFYSEVELGMFQDLGHAVNIRNQFGASIYTNGNTVNYNRGYGANWNATDNSYDSNPNTARFGVGLHVVGDKNNVNIVSNIYTVGEAAAGIRIEGSDNTIYIQAGQKIASNGTNGYGVLVTHGNEATVVNSGVIEAIGSNGVGVYLNSGSWSDRTDSRINAYEISGGARQFDNTGTINAGTNDAIRFAGNMIDTPTVNIMAGSVIVGNIAANANTSGVITFGKAADANGNSTNAGDEYFNMTLNSNMYGDGIITLETWGGRDYAHG